MSSSTVTTKTRLTSPPTVRKRDCGPHVSNSPLILSVNVYVVSALSERSYVELLDEVTSLKRAGKAPRPFSEVTHTTIVYQNLYFRVIIVYIYFCKR